MKRMRIFELAVIGFSLLLAALLAFHGMWWGAAGWLVNAALWALVGPCPPAAYIRFEARQMVGFTDRTVSALRRQGERRVDVRDQTEWLLESLEGSRSELRRIVAGEERPTRKQADVLFDRVMLDAAPAIEQHAQDAPTWLNRFFAWKARWDARRFRGGDSR